MRLASTFLAASDGEEKLKAFENSASSFVAIALLQARTVNFCFCARWPVICGSLRLLQEMARVKSALDVTVSSEFEKRHCQSRSRSQIMATRREFKGPLQLQWCEKLHSKPTAEVEGGKEINWAENYKVQVFNFLFKGFCGRCTVYKKILVGESGSPLAKTGYVMFLESDAIYFCNRWLNSDCKLLSREV